MEYFLEFSPVQNGYSTTKFALEIEDLEGSGEVTRRINVKFEDTTLSKMNEDFSYILSLDSREIGDTNVDFYDDYMTGTHSELFLDTSDIGNSQIFRIDEIVVFADYFRRDLSEILKKLDIEFTSIGEEPQSGFITYHYNSVYKWETQGIS